MPNQELTEKWGREEQRSNALLWSDRPAVGPVLIVLGMLFLLAIVILVSLEWFLGNYVGGFTPFLPRSAQIGDVVVQYPVEILTIVILLAIYLGKVIQLAFIRIRNKYELYEDGLYLQHGVLNLENSFLSPVAFSDVILYRSVWLRIVGRGNIIIHANDGRQFRLSYIKEPLKVQNLMRETLTRLRVRI